MQTLRHAWVMWHFILHEMPSLDIHKYHPQTWFCPVGPLGLFSPALFNRTNVSCNEAIGKSNGVQYRFSYLDFGIRLNMVLKFNSALRLQTVVWYCYFCSIIFMLHYWHACVITLRNIDKCGLIHKSTTADTITTSANKIQEHHLHNVSNILHMTISRVASPVV